MLFRSRPGALGLDGVEALQATRNRSLSATAEIAAAYFPGDALKQRVAERYLRDNIKYSLGADECAGLERFYAYAAEAAVIARRPPLTFFEGRAVART